MPELLVTNADNEFVGRLITSLSTKHGVSVRAWGASPAVFSPQVHLVDGPADESHALISMPTDDGAAARATGAVDQLGGDTHILFIANELDPTHQAVIDHIKASGNPWTILNPVAMMDFSFAALPPQVSMAGVVFGISGRSKVGFVAASDVMRMLAAIIDSGGHQGQEYVCTGPQAQDMPGVVAALSETLGWGIDYIDLPEDELRNLMVQYGRQDAGAMEVLVFRQLRAWRDGHCDVVTSAVADVTGQEPISVAQWFAEHREDFPKGQSFAQKAAARLVKAKYRNHVMR